MEGIREDNLRRAQSIIKIFIIQESEMRKIVFLVAILGCVGLLSGCGGPNMATVKGKVTCNGNPVKEAQITFSPVPKDEKDREAGKPATGFTDEQGYFELSTFKPLDGALIGEHRVYVMIDDTNPAKCKREKRTTFEVKPGPNNCEIELTSK